jgi:ATP-binding cassette subfamily C (CFTR/MRP) protein 1
MLELESGKIQVDGVDISRVPRDLLRERCFVTIAQDPLIMPGETLRYNLDPSLLESDAVLFKALAQAALGAHFTREDGDAGSSSTLNNGTEEVADGAFLDVEISKLPALSAGQTQLLALARALVKVKSLRNLGVQPIVLLDEVTSSVDPVTESTMHGVIEEELVDSGLTVIIVAHRLGVLADHANPDKEVIIWMKDGRLQEES